MRRERVGVGVGAVNAARGRGLGGIFLGKEGVGGRLGGDEGVDHGFRVDCAEAFVGVAGD